MTFHHFYYHHHVNVTCHIQNSNTVIDSRQMIFIIAKIKKFDQQKYLSQIKKKVDNCTKNVQKKLTTTFDYTYTDLFFV